MTSRNSEPCPVRCSGLTPEFFMKPHHLLLAFVLLASAAFGADPQTNITQTIQVAPTRLQSTKFRGGQGNFGASRGPGKTHAGVDLVANQSSMDKSVYQVRAVGGGRIAYSRMNGANGTEGYGFTVIVDHGTGWYTLYAHLATKATQDLHRVGDTVQAGDIIGYMADLAANDLSTGNVTNPIVKEWDKIQVHFEIFPAPAGRSSTGAIADIKQGASTEDPTNRLILLGYMP